MLADCQSFYATVEKVAHPEYADKPLVVAGDPERRNGIILAACPLAKQHGITTAENLGSALSKCSDLIVIRPRMEEYIKVSLHITNIYESYTELVEPYSIDEQFLDVTGTMHMYDNDVRKIAAAIQQHVMRETGVRIRIGIGQNKILAKTACDNYVKKNKEGVYVLTKEKLPDTFWQLPIEKAFMVGRRMTTHLIKMGIHSICDLANTPLSKLRKRWGVNGEVLWRIANGIDNSPVNPQTHHVQKGIGHHMTLPRDYKTMDEIKTPLRELTEQVCQRARSKKLMGSVIAVDCRGTDFDYPTGFHRQKKIDDPTYTAAEMYEVIYELFNKYWDGLPVRSIGVSLGNLVSDQIQQIRLFNPCEKHLALERAADQIKLRFGDGSLIRAASATLNGQAIDRAQKIGGHYK